ncbi:MAG: hypothetical protein JWN17_1857 [Frankiales bacterium]|nr:hypothetical protein [Frankiales bacterium]
MSDGSGWATPGVPFSRPGDPAGGPATSAAAGSTDGPTAGPTAGLAADVLELVAVLDRVLAVDPAVLAPQVAVVRAEVLLASQDRLAAAGLRAVGDVQERDLWRVRSAGSTRTWLRTLPCGDAGQLTALRLLQDRPLLAGALQDGSVSLRTAVTVARHLARVPGAVEPDQLQAVLVDGLGDLLSVWVGAACLEPTAAQEAEYDRRREQLAAVVRAGLQDCWSDPAGQLEPAFVLAAQVLTPAQVETGLGVLVDALQPGAAAEELAEQEYRSRGLVLRKLRSGGWSLRAHLTDETGQLLHTELTRRTHKTPGTPSTAAPSTPSAAAAPSDGPAKSAPATDGDPVQNVEAVFGQPLSAADASDGSAGPDGTAHDGSEPDTTAPASTESDDADRFGTTGPGTPLSLDDLNAPAEQGTPLLTQDQQLHEALTQLLTDLLDVDPGHGTRTPAHLTITAPLDALHGRPGAPPGRLHTAHGDVPLTPSQLRNHTCGGLLSAVLLDAHGRPVAASGTHRHATARERRVLRATWGTTCAVNGCTQPGTIPHHAEPWWKTHQTRPADLVPICPHHHHDVHEGHKTLALRDHRLLHETGWNTTGPAAHSRLSRVSG